jgi:hypothetical protein
MRRRVQNYPDDLHKFGKHLLSTKNKNAFKKEGEILPY